MSCWIRRNTINLMKHYLHNLGLLVDFEMLKLYIVHVCPSDASFYLILEHGNEICSWAEEGRKAWKKIVQQLRSHKHRGFHIYSCLDIALIFIQCVQPNP